MLSPWYQKWGKVILWTGIFALSPMLMTVCGIAHAQPALIEVGPFGRPLMVRNEGGDFQPALRVYADKGIEVYIPDPTLPGPMWWYVNAWPDKDKYSTYLYEHFLTPDYCVKNFIPPEGKHDADLIDSCKFLRYRRRHVLMNFRDRTFTVYDAVNMLPDGKWNGSVKQVNQTFTLAEASKHTRGAIERIESILKQEAQRWPKN